MPSLKLIAVFLLAAPLLARDDDTKAGHSAHGEAFNEGPRQQAYLIPGMGNIHFTDDASDEVQGVVHACEDDALATLDRLEAYGVGYDRIEVEVLTDDGPVRAQAYIGLPAFIDASRLPTRRYLSILSKGAMAAGLDETYIRRLRTLTMGLLTPFYFLRAGTFVTIPVLIAAPAAFIVLFVGKVLSSG